MIGFRRPAAGVRAAWRRLRARPWLSLGVDVAILVALMWGIHSWQTRELPIDEPAPRSVLEVLGGEDWRPAVTAGETGVVYFFAPWCRICRASIANLDALVARGRVGWGAVVALDYQDAGEIVDFVAETGLSLPVLMGTARTAREWSVPGFPTYYVIDADGRIHSRSVGYSTYLGMLLRTWLASSGSQTAG